jgi:hypothetical protein
MTDHHPIRLFADDAAVRRIAAGLLDRTLPRAEWTHEAHLAACACLLLEYPHFVAVGGVNDATQGYHETITQFYVAVVSAYLADDLSGSLAERVNRLLTSERGARDYPLRFWSRDRLFSTEARLGRVAPDLRALAEC